MLAPDTVLNNRYKVVRLLAQGGMGAVYLATDLIFNRQVALKQSFFTDERLSRAFKREAVTLNHLRHPAPPIVVDFFAHAGGQFLVMDFVPGLAGK